MVDETEIREEETLTDEDIAILANKELKKRDEEIASLKKQLAKEKLYSKAPEEKTVMSKDDCIKVIFDGSSCNYDYAKAVVNLVDIETSEGRVNPLGEDGDAVYELFSNVIKECGDDKDRFTSVYQSKIGQDPSDVSFAYKNITKNIK